MWTVLRGIKCWEKYQKETAQALGILGLPVAWGNGPKEYPALVTTYMPPTQPGQSPRLVSAYVYESDAVALLHGGGRKMVPVALEQGVVVPRQNDFNRWVAAYLLALTREMRDVGALKAERFEGSLMESLQLVDEAATERRDAVVAGLSKQESNILDRLVPPG